MRGTGDAWTDVGAGKSVGVAGLLGHGLHRRSWGSRLLAMKR